MNIKIMIVKLYTRKKEIILNKTLFILNDDDFLSISTYGGAIFGGEDEDRQLIIDIDKKYDKDSDFEYYQKKITPVLLQELRKKKFKNIF
jgi:hypothetical protein